MCRAAETNETGIKGRIFAVVYRVRQMAFTEAEWRGVDAQKRRSKLHVRSTNMPFVLLDTLHFDMIVSTMVQSAGQSDPIGQPNVVLRYTEALGQKGKGAGRNANNVRTANQQQVYPGGSRVASRPRPMDWVVHVHKILLIIRRSTQILHSFLLGFLNEAAKMQVHTNRAWRATTKGECAAQRQYSLLAAHSILLTLPEANFARTADQ